MNILDHIAKSCSKELKEEDNNIRQILLTLFSAWTNNPQNLRILAPSGEGKTYLVTKLASLFPQENIIVLGKASPQSLKYNLNSKRVVENGSGNWQDYDVAVEPLEEELEKIKDKERIQEIKKQIRELQDSACDFVDFSNKVIIFVDSQSFEMFESLKPTMSHDQEYIKSFSVNKSKSGTMRGQKFIFHGFPAIIYCSAKDEIVKDETNEINTRFNTISLNASRVKYRKMLEFEALSSSLPHSIRQEEIISDTEIEALRQEIQDIINQIPDSGEIINPYGAGLSKLFNDDAGSRTRQFKILNNNIRMHTLVNAKFRPKIIYDGIATPIATRLDVEESCKLTKETREIQPYKIKYFNDHIRKAILETGKEKQTVSGPIRCLTASEIADYITKKGITTDRQRLQETYLKHLVSHGFLEESLNEDNKSRHVFAVSTPYIEKEAKIESTLIDTSLLDESCVESFVSKFIKQRFDSGKLEIFHADGNTINLEQLLDILQQIVTDIPKNSHENDSVEASTSNDGEMS
jgi:hypothetical protein